MVQLATAGEARLSCDRAEIDRDAPSYTIDTLRALRASAPGTALTLILGSDALAGFDRWKDADEIRTIADVKALQRPGAAASPGAVGFEGPAFSSSAIRTAVAAGRSIRFLVPEPVRAYIEWRGLYA
jgi:nicotinate-nucleotide adenylyltransferase